MDLNVFFFCHFASCEIFEGGLIFYMNSVIVCYARRSGIWTVTSAWFDISQPTSWN